MRAPSVFIIKDKMRINMRTRRVFLDMIAPEYRNYQREKLFCYSIAMREPSLNSIIEMEKWVIANLSDIWSAHYGTFFFKSASDAAFFKLWWHK